MERPSTQEAELGNELNYKIGDKVATRKAYGNALVRLIKNGSTHLLALDGDLSASTFSN